MKEYDLITLGEILLRLSPQNGERILKGGPLDRNIGGAELNVASGVAMLGLNTAILSSVPDNPLGESAIKAVRQASVDDKYIHRVKDDRARLGIYFYEGARYPKTPRVVYDRANSSFVRYAVDDMDPEVFKNARLFHFSGIDLALSPDTRDTVIEVMKRFKENGALISFDVNFRGNLWTGEEAKAVIEPILPYVDILFCSEDTARLTFLKEGTLPEIQKEMCEENDIDLIFSTKRTVRSPLHHDFTSYAYDHRSGQYFEDRPYEQIEVVDRVGSGDAYVSGVLYSLLTNGDPAEAVKYGNACAALKCTVPGDLPSGCLKEVDEIIDRHQITEGFIPEMSR